MKIVKREDAFYVVPDEWSATVKPLAGPFRDTREACWWMVERAEQSLNPERTALWGQALEAMGGMRADPFRALYIVVSISRGWNRERIWKYVGQPERPDRKKLAAGESEAA